MKTLFMEPELEVTRFTVEDVITTSADLDEDELPPVVVG